jgi:hypothetical protein
VSDAIPAAPEADLATAERTLSTSEGDHGEPGLIGGREKAGQLS